MADWFSDIAPRIKRFEGYAPVAQWDNRQWTNGYGTRARYAGERIDEKEAALRFQNKLSRAHDSVLQFAPDADPGTISALTDLTYNAGAGWQGAGLGKAIQAKNWALARELYRQYNNESVGGQLKPNAGLTRRRNEMAPMIGSGALPAPIEQQGDTSMSAPTFIQKSPQSRIDLYNEALAKALMGTRPTTGNAFEGATSALARGVGTYYTLNHEQAQDEKKQALINALTGAHPADASLAAYADLDPAEALKLEIADRQQKAASAREDSRLKAAEDRADARNKMTLDREDARAKSASQLELSKFALKEAGEANNPANWETSQRGAYTIMTNKVTGATRTYRGGVLVKQEGGVQPPVVPMPGGTPAAPVSVTPPPVSPVSRDGTMPVQPQPVVNAGARPGPTIENAAALEAAKAAAPPSVPGLTYDNGEYETPRGYRYKATLANGQNAPADLFTSKYLFAQDDKSAGPLLESSLADDREQAKTLREASANWKRMKPQLEIANEAIKEAGRTGWKGDIMQSLRNFGATIGIPVEGLTSAQLIESIGLRSTPQVRQGLPGSVSNYEMQQYSKAVIGLGNTPEANYILNRMMMLQGKSAEIDQKVADQYLREKREVGLEPILDDGYRARLEQEYAKHPIFTEKEQQLLALANSGKVKAADLDAFANGKKTYEQLTTKKTRKAAVSTDGTVSKSAPALAAADNDTMELDGKRYRVKRDAQGNILDAEELQ